MAKYECSVNAEFNEFSKYLHDEIINSSLSATYEDGCTFSVDDTLTQLSVYERYSYAGGNRVSLSVMLTKADNGRIKVCAITSGGSQALFFKMNTLGEESFLDKFKEAVEKYGN